MTSSFCVFFFKQKTAYEMRISDWSSDVCSSDLLDIHCDGDTHIDDHHTVEDVGITLGQAFAAAVGDKAGLRRYGHSYVPLDEALSRVVVDFSGDRQSVV